MPKVISEEKRKDIIFHKQNGVESKVISAFLRVTVRVVDKIWKQYRDTNSIENKIQNCGRKSVISEDLEREIIDEIKKTPDITLLELVEKFQIPITEGGLSKWLCKRGFSYKKRRHTPLNKTVLMFNKNGKNS